MSPSMTCNSCLVHVVHKDLISILVTDCIQKRRGQALLFSYEYNLLPKIPFDYVLWYRVQIGYKLSSICHKSNLAKVCFMCNMVAPFCRSMSYIVSYNSWENAQTKEKLFRGAIVKIKIVICVRQLDCKLSEIGQDWLR